MKLAKWALIRLAYLYLAAPHLCSEARLLALFLQVHYVVGTLLDRVELVLFFETETRRKVPEIVAEISVDYPWCRLAALRLLIEEHSR